MAFQMLNPVGAFAVWVIEVLVNVRYYGQRTAVMSQGNDKDSATA